MQTISKSVAQMPVQVIALKPILVAGEVVAQDTQFTMQLDEYHLASGDNIELAPGEVERIKAAIIAASPKHPNRAQREAEQAERQAQHRAEIAAVTAAANARNTEATERRNALERLIQGAMSMGR